jgi:hypothetical protein
LSIETSAVAAGWYTDPSGSHSLRWWDGTQWTNHLRQPEAPVAPVAPAAVVPAVVASPAVPVAHQAAYATTTLPPVGLQNSELSAYSPGNGFGGAQQTGWGNSSYSDAPTVSRGPVNNSVAWIGFGAGILSFAIVIYLFTGPKGNYYVPFFGLTAVIASIRAILRYRQGRVSVLWAPIIGLVLGSISEVIVIALLIIGSTVNGNSVAITNTGTNSGTSQGTTPSTSTFTGPTGPVIVYDAGSPTPNYLPTSNGSLAQALQTEQSIVTNLKNDYSPTADIAASDGKWPSGLTLDGTTGDLIASDGKTIGTPLQGGAWVIDYHVESNGSFDLAVASTGHPLEVAAYVSTSNRYGVVCESNDLTCATNSPLGSKSMTLPSVTNSTS